MCHRSESLGDAAFSGQTGGANFENLARLENLLPFESMQSREKTERTGTEARESTRW